MAFRLGNQCYADLCVDLQKYIIPAALFLWA